MKEGGREGGREEEGAADSPSQDKSLVRDFQLMDDFVLNYDKYLPILHSACSHSIRWEAEGRDSITLALLCCHLSLTMQNG